MRAYEHPGDVMDYTAPSGGVSSGVPFKHGQQLAVPQDDAAQGDVVACVVRGVVSGPKTDSQAWAEGDLIYWDPTPGEFTNVSATGHLLVGTAAAAVGSGAGLTTGSVRLDGCARADVA